MNAPFILAVIENPFLKFGVNRHDLTSQVIAFLIVAWVLNQFVFKTVRKTVEARQKEADEAVENSHRIQRELLAAEEARKEALHKAHEQGEKLISEAKAYVAEMIEREKQRCEQLGVEMLAQAREEARLAQARLKTELRGDIATLIINLTAQLTQQNLNAADRDRLLQSAIREIAASSPKTQS